MAPRLANGLESHAPTLTPSLAHRCAGLSRKSQDCVSSFPFPLAASALQVSVLGENNGDLWMGANNILSYC